jgi:hypothetical protein
MHTLSCGTLSRNSLAIMALCAFAPVLAAQQTHPTPEPLLHVAWGAPADSLMKQAAAAGWRFLEIDEDGDYAFHAQLDGAEALVFATMSDSGLTRLLVSIAPHATADSTYHRIADTLRAHFGPAPLISGKEMGLRPARGLAAASAWRGILMGLRWDRAIIILFTCPGSSPDLPTLPGHRTRIA